jgi:sugar phosphate isomerase/epimerase
MRPGIFARTFDRPSVEEVLDAVVAHGLRCVQLNLAVAGVPTLPDHVPPGLVERVAQAAAERGVEIAAVSATANLIHPDPERRRDGLRRLAVVADVAAALGAPVVTLSTGTRDPDDVWRRHAGNDAPDAWDDLLRSLAAVLEAVEPRGVVAAFEPESGNVVDSAAKARRLLDAVGSPWLRVVLDPANLQPRGGAADPDAVVEQALALLGRDVVLAHAKGFTAGGPLDLDRYVVGLRRAGYDGAVILHGLAEDDVPAGVALLADALRSADGA